MNNDLANFMAKAGALRTYLVLVRTKHGIVQTTVRACNCNHAKDLAEERLKGTAISYGEKLKE